MKKLIFNFHFCLLITMFVFVATQAMAVVEIECTAEYTLDDPNTPKNERSITIKLKYNVPLDPPLSLDDFKSQGGMVFPPDTVLSDGGDNDPRTYEITRTNVGTTGFTSLVGFHLKGIRVIPFPVNIFAFNIFPFLLYFTTNL